MAFVSDYAFGEFHAPKPLEAARPAPLFSTLEWQVIGLAMQDGRSTLWPAPIADGIRKLAGSRRSAKLADPALEQLRRLAISYRLCAAETPKSELEAFLAYGYTETQATALRWAVEAHRPTTASSGGMMSIAALATIAVGLGLAAAQEFAEPLIGLVAGGLSFATGAALSRSPSRASEA